MPPQTRFDIVIVGHFAIDTISSARIRSARTTLGGPPTYVSVAAARLGSRVSVISKVGGDFPSEYRDWLNDNHIDLSGLKQVVDSPTTRFDLKYQATGKRILRLKSQAPEITTSDIPRSLKAEIIHASPIASELSSEVIAVLRKASHTLSLDPQGFVRGLNSHGYVRLKPWFDSSILEVVDVYKSSVDELKMITGLAEVKQATRKIQDYGVKVVIVTRGLRGSTLLFDNTFYNVPAFRSRQALDPTGAGDAFIGAFLAEYIRSTDLLWCACVGSASASFVIEGFGPERFGERQETYERARGIYQKCLKRPK